MHGMLLMYRWPLAMLKGCLIFEVVAAVERSGHNPPDASNVLVRIGRLMTKSFVVSNCEYYQMSLCSHVARNESVPTMALLERMGCSW